MAEVMIARLEENLKQAMLYGVRNYIQYLQVDPGKLGAEVSEGKNYKPKKDFAYGMCARRPTSAMPKPSFLCEPAFSHSNGGDVPW